MTPEELEWLGFEKWFDDVDGTEDYMYELKVAPGFTLYSDYVSDLDKGELGVYWDEYIVSLDLVELKQLISLIMKGIRNDQT